MSLQSAIIGFLVSRILAIPITPQENVVIQTTAVATGTVRRLLRSASEFNSQKFVSQMPLAAGFVGIIPALGLLDEKKDGSGAITLTWSSAVAWSCAIAYFG